MAEERVNQQQQQQQQQQGQGAVQVLLDQVKHLPPDTLSEIARALEEIQTNLDPIRDRALDQKSYWTGYAKCSEDFIKMIASRSIFVKGRSEEKKKAESEAKTEQNNNITELKERIESKTNDSKKSRSTKKSVTKQVEDES